MEIYKIEPRFDKKTGKPVDGERVWKETRCDFTGEVLTEKYWYDKYYCKFELNYGSKDSCMGADGEEYEFGKKYNIDVYQFLNEPYVIWEEEGDHIIMKEFLKKAVKYETLDNAFRTFRIKTATKLLKAGVITAEQLIGCYGA